MIFFFFHVQNVHLHELDVSKPRDIVAFAQSFKKSGHPLHVLVRATIVCYCCQLQIDAMFVSVAQHQNRTLYHFNICELSIVVVRKLF